MLTESRGRGFPLLEQSNPGNLAVLGTLIHRAHTRYVRQPHQPTQPSHAAGADPEPPHSCAVEGQGHQGVRRGPPLTPSGSQGALWEPGQEKGSEAMF